MKLSKEQLEALKRPLPPEAIKPHPTKSYLSTINAIYVTDRLNEVFGTGEWKLQTEVIDSSSQMVTVKVTFTVDKFDIHLEQFGGNDNRDKGDALKGATTDALTKIGSYLGIGADVWKGKGDSKPKQRRATKTYDTSMVNDNMDKLINLAKKGHTADQIFAVLRTEGFQISAGAKDAIKHITYEHIVAPEGDGPPF